MRQRVIVLVAFLSACGPSFEPASYVSGLRVLAVIAEPPEVAPGASTSLTALVVDPTGARPNVTWAACTLPIAPGIQVINPDCFTADQAPYLTPLGAGDATIRAILPAVNPGDFGPPDASGGFYLPLRVRAQAGTKRIDAAYRLRLAIGMQPNQNPRFLPDREATAVRGTESEQVLVETRPLEVHRGDSVRLRARFTDDSYETYQQTFAGQSRTVTESLAVAWFATGGSLSEAVTGLDKPDTIWRADAHLPPTGSLIDLWLVGRDERGGAVYAHRAFKLQ